MSEHREAADAAEKHAYKLERLYRVHGREGLKEFSGEDVCFLYWCLRHQVREIDAKIESGRGMEYDRLIKEQIVAQVNDLREELGERHENLERGAELER